MEAIEEMKRILPSTSDLCWLEMIAQEIMEYKAQKMAMSQQGGNLPRPKERSSLIWAYLISVSSLAGPNRDHIGPVPRDEDEDQGQAMDVDDELRMRESTQVPG